MGYKQLTIEERESILKFTAMGFNQNMIAKELMRHKSTICRELKRNFRQSEYSPNLAQLLYKSRKKNCGNKNILAFNIDLNKRIRDMLKDDFSPEQIEGRLKLQNQPVVAFKTIYRSIKNGVLNVEAKVVLRRKGKSKKHGVKETRGVIPDKTMIDKRPIEANQRLEIGHFESDTVIGAGKKGAIVTYVDRKSRYLFADIMPDRKASTTNRATIEMFSAIPNNILKTFTSDNGKEFAKFKELEKQLNVKNYFANPYHSWERGTNENTNGLLRQYFPKGTYFSEITKKELKKIVTKLNNRPRKILGYKTPSEVFWSEIKKSCA